MFDLSKRKFVKTIKVKDLINILELENPEGIITIDESDEFFIHITQDDNHIAIDLSDLDDYYYDYYKRNNKKFPKTLSKSTKKPFKANNIMDKSECMNLLKLVVENISHQFLLNHGFSQKQIDFIQGENNERK